MLHVTPRVFIVDPDASVRASLEVLIRRAGWRPEPFASAAGFLARQPLSVPSSVVLDVAHPDLGGFELLRRVASERPETPVIAVSSQRDIPMAVRAMKAGAAEFLVKPVATDVLQVAIGNAIAQSRAMLEEAAELVELRSRYALLSTREREVMAGVVAGHLNKQVGAALGISEITVKAHRGKAMRKMLAESLADLVLMAIKLGLPDGPTWATSPARSILRARVLTGRVGRTTEPLTLVAAS